MATFGRAPILDFDGTIVRLPVDWQLLRTELVVARIDELWEAPDTTRWEQVREAECAAAARAVLVDPVVRRLEAVESFAVLTSNSEEAVRLALARLGPAGQRVATVVGRETLGGSKLDFDVFAKGFAACVEATSRAREEGETVYVGDMPYELEFATRLGARVIDARSIGE